MSGGPAPYRKTNRAERVELAQIIFDLRVKGLSYRAIEAATLEPDGPTGGTRIPWATARDIANEEADRRIAPKVDAWRAIVVERLESAHARLDYMDAAARTVLERHHVTVNNGQIIRVEGEPLLDDAPVLAAVDRLVKIEDARLKNNESIRRLFGLDAPARVEAMVTETTQQDIALQELLTEMRAKNANTIDTLRAQREQSDG